MIIRSVFTTGVTTGVRFIFVAGVIIRIVFTTQTGVIIRFVFIPGVLIRITGVIIRNRNL